MIEQMLNMKSGKKTIAVKVKKDVCLSRCNRVSMHRVLCHPFGVEGLYSLFREEENKNCVYLPQLVCSLYV